MSDALNQGNQGTIDWDDVRRRHRDVDQANRDVIRDALQQIGIGPAATGGDEEDEEPQGEEPVDEGEGRNYIDDILEDEYRDLEVALEELVQRGTISGDQAQGLVQTVAEVSTDMRCPEVTLDAVDLDPTERVARMDVVVRGPAMMGEPALHHVTGTARTEVSKCLNGNPESRRVRPTNPGVEEVGREEDAQQEEEAEVLEFCFRTLTDLFFGKLVGRICYSGRPPGNWIWPWIITHPL